MTPTIEKGDRVIADMRAFSAHDPVRGEVVIIARGSISYVKRVIAVPGEVVSINGGVVSIDGNPIAESYVSLTEGAEAYGRDFQATKVPAHRYFLLGDARDIALDSRSEEFGMIDRGQIKGRVHYVWDSGRIGRRADHAQPTPLPGGPNS